MDLSLFSLEGKTALVTGVSRDRRWRPPWLRPEPILWA